MRTQTGDDGDALVRAFEGEIIEYLRERPRQLDDFDGVLYWWLFHRRYVRNADLVARALACLVEAGWVVRIEHGDGRALFGAGDRLKAELAGGGDGSPTGGC